MSRQESLKYTDSNTSQLQLSALSARKIPTHALNTEELQIQYSNPAERYKFLEFLILNSSDKKKQSKPLKLSDINRFSYQADQRTQPSSLSQTKRYSLSGSNTNAGQKYKRCQMHSEKQVFFDKKQCRLLCSRSLTALKDSVSLH